MAMAKAKTRKPKGYFLGGITKSLFGSEQKTKIQQPKYIDKLQGPFTDLVRGELRRPDEATVAPFSADSQGAFQQVRDLATGDPTGYGGAMDFAKGAITSAFDQGEPWNEKLVQSVLQDYDRSTDMDRARAARNQAGRGAFGDRAYIDDLERDRTATNDRAMLAQQLMESGIDRRTSAAGALAGLAGDERATAVQGAQLLDLSGQRQEAREQQVRDAPFKRMAAVAPIFGSAPSATNTQSQDSPFKTIGGLGLAAAGIPAIAGLFKDGGKVEKYQDGGLTAADIEAAKAGDAAAMARVRAAMQYQPGGAFSDARSTADRERQPRTPRTDDPRMEAAEARRAGPPAPTMRDTIRDWVDDNPFSRGIQEGIDVLTGKAPMVPDREAAEPTVDVDRLFRDVPPPTRSAFAPPQPKPARTATATTPQPRAGRPQANPPTPRPARSDGPPPLPEQPTQQQAVAIGGAIAQQMAPSVPEEERGAFAKWIENPLTLMGLGMLASQNPTFAGAFGEGALGAMDIINQREAQEFDQNRQMTADERAAQGLEMDAAEAERRRRRDAIEDERWSSEFGYSQEKDRQTFDLARQRLDEEARVNNARIQNFLRPRATPASATRPHYDPFTTQALKNLADQYAMAIEMEDSAAAERILAQYNALAANAPSEAVPGTPGDDYDIFEE